MTASFVIRTSFFWCAALAVSAANGESTAFVNVNVVPMTSEVVVESQTVIVVDGVITRIGGVADTAVPDDAVVVDGTDRFLMPGLGEMHGHVPGRTSGNLDRVLGLYVANGVTTVRGMLGQPSHLVMRSEIRNRTMLGPRLITSGPSFNDRSVSSPEQGSQMVRDQHEAGYDFLKIHPGLTLKEFNAVAGAANDLGIRFAGHVPEDVGVQRALAAGIATIDHLDGYMEALLPPNDDPLGGLAGFFGVFIADQADLSKIEKVAQATADAKVWNVPTESLFEHVTVADWSPEDMARWPEMKYMPQEVVAQWESAKRDVLNDVNYDAQTARRAVEIRQKIILALKNAGAGLLLGSDSPQIFNVPGFALHRELEFLVAAGLTPFEALQTGTVSVAKFFSSESSFGSVREGLEADLILLDANPLEDIRNSRRIHGVMVRGTWLSRADLDRLLGRFER
ncbi:MAG: amidohydrolase family protein [Proteobacteria bacterium]|nr:amidohydrolase family protein [Pseudomonadota bacterium]MDA0994450.1 amidohydrolase family protein [Pseudomonadota bacterium]